MNDDLVISESIYTNDELVLMSSNVWKSAETGYIYGKTQIGFYLFILFYFLKLMARLIIEVLIHRAS